MKICIIYDTVSGNTEQMANSVAAGVREVPGVDVEVKHVNDATPDDMLADGLIIGSPTWCGQMTWQLKKFFDEVALRNHTHIDGRIGAAFASSGGLGGGNEMTLLSILTALMNYGYLVFGIPQYAGEAVTAHYGAVSVGMPGRHERIACRMLGKRCAEYVVRNAKGNAAAEV